MSQSDYDYDDVYEEDSEQRKTPAKVVKEALAQECVLFSRSIGLVTPKIIYFHYL